MSEEPKCKRCNDTGWREPIGPCSDGSYITSRPCNCDAYDRWLADDAAARREQEREIFERLRG